MKVNKQIRDKILYDNNFSLELASSFGIQQASLRLLARRNSGKLTQYQAIQFYKKNGFTEEEMFEEEQVKKIQINHADSNHIHPRLTNNAK